MATTTNPQRSRSAGRSARRAALAVVALAFLATAGCGGGYYEDPYYPPGPVPVYGTVEVDNLTDTTTFENVYGFYLSLAGSGSWTGNLLSGPLPPGFAEIVGDFLEDFYDAEADVGDFGDVAFWDAVFVPAGDITTFEVF
jgi:hypothetical protein